MKCPSILAGCAALFLAAATGCGGAGAQPVAASSDLAIVVIHPSPGHRVDIDPHEPRIEASSRAITEMIGHRLTYEIDSAVVAQFDGWLQSAFVTAVETIAHTIAYGRQHHADAYAFAGSTLRTIAFTYTPVDDRAASTFDARTGTLRVPIRPSDSSLIGGGDIEYTFDEAWKDHQKQHFASVAPEAVAKGEQRAYFEFIKGSSSDETLDCVDRIVRLYGKTDDPALQRDLRQWLLGEGDTISRMRPKDDAERRRIRATSGRYSAWLNVVADGLDDDERNTVGRFVFFPFSGGPEPTCISLWQDTDLLRLATPDAERWSRALEAGKRTEADSMSMNSGLLDRGVCPVKWYPDMREFGDRGCAGGAMYGCVMSTPAGARRLADWMAHEHSEPLTQTAVVNVADGRGSDVLLALLDALEQNDALVITALRTLGDYTGWGRAERSGRAPGPDPAPVARRIPGWWAAHPSRHGALLYLVARLGLQKDGPATWNRLPQWLGGTISEADFAAFLDAGPSAFWSILEIGQALGHGWSRARVVVPRFGRWLDEDRVHNTREMTERVIEALCENGSREDIEQFKIGLRARFEVHPTERGDVGDLAVAKPERLCSSESAARKARLQAVDPKKPVLFGD